MRALERIEKLDNDFKTPGIELYPGQRNDTGYNNIEFLLKSFHVMSSIAYEMADMASGNNGDYGEIENQFEEAMKKEAVR